MAAWHGVTMAAKMKLEEEAMSSKLAA